MPEFSPCELSQWVSRMWENGMPEGAITGVTQDTRKLKPGNLYVAVKGDRFDGHDFLRQAFEAGASGALVEEGCQWTSNPVLPVSDSIRGLQDLARGYRRKWTGMVVGITGSVGKTTVKEMCADVLTAKGETHRTSGNYNNHIGLPLTMLAMPQTAAFGVFEIGMNQPGEIGELSGLLQPGIGIITDICNAHRGNFQSLDGIAREKARLAEHIPSSGRMLLDCDSEWFPLMCKNTYAHVVTVSLEGDADYVGRKVDQNTIRVDGFDYTMPQPGEHVMRNALRAIALGLELGIDPEQIAAGLGRFKAPPMRWEESDIAGIHFINDAYNANPLSMRANLKAFADLPSSGGKWAIVGGMRELGDVTEAEHAELGRFIDELQLDGVIAIGELGHLIVCKGSDRFHQCPDAAEASRILKDNLKPGDSVLLKASRGEHLEEVLEYFKEM